MEHSVFEDVCRLNARYGQLYDDGAFDTWMELFLPDAVFTVRGTEYCGHAGLRAFVESRRGAGPGKHMLGLPVITTMTASDCTADVDYIHLRSRDSGVAISAGRYHDRLRVRNGEWYFASRSIILADGFRPA